MRPIRLARIAAEAEGVRLKGMVSRIATRAIFGVVAFAFIIGAIVFGHIAVWFELRTALDQTFLAATGELAGADLLVVIILGLLASRSSPSRVEREALDVRRKAVEAIGGTFSLASLAVPVLRIGANLRRRGRD